MYTFAENDDLPEEIVNELSKRGRSATATTGTLQILKIIVECGGSAVADQIIIGLYKKFGIKIKRMTLQSRLHFLKKEKGFLKSTDVDGVLSITDKGKKLLPSSDDNVTQLSAAKKSNPSKDANKEKQPSPKTPAANVNEARTIICKNCETAKTFKAGKIIFRFDDEDFCTPECIKEYRESKL